MPTSCVETGLPTEPPSPVAGLRTTRASAPPPRVRLFGIDIAQLRLDDAVARLLEWCHEPSGVCRYVVTPNVDHLVILQDRADFLQAYQDADLVLADGWPLVLASRWLGRPLPERVAGSDVIPALLRAASANSPLNVFLLGAAPGVAELAARRLATSLEGVRVVGIHSPPLGFEHDESENERILRRIAAAAPDLLLIGLGAPKQELWVHRQRTRLRARVAVCAGAVIDFLAGARPRAPRWMQRHGLEWLHRLHGEPRRLAHRYLRDAIVFPRLVWREWRSRSPDTIA